MVGISKLSRTDPNRAEPSWVGFQRFSSCCVVVVLSVFLHLHIHLLALSIYFKWAPCLHVQSVDRSKVFCEEPSCFSIFLLAKHDHSTRLDSTPSTWIFNTISINYNHQGKRWIQIYMLALVSLTFFTPWLIIMPSFIWQWVWWGALVLLLRHQQDDDDDDYQGLSLSVSFQSSSSSSFVLIPTP